MVIAEVLEFVAKLRAMGTVTEAADGIDLITALEDVKSASAAIQAQTSESVAQIIKDDRKEKGRPQAQWHKGIASQIGLARRESPNKGGRYLGLARALIHEMPYTYARLLAGDINEWRATLIVRETACLSKDDRAIADERLCHDPATLRGLGDNAIEGKARVVATELDAASVVRRFEKSYANRRTSTRPQPDYMTTFSVLTSMDRGVCMWATLRRDADSIINAGGESRTRDQIMADLAYERITGAESAAAGAPASVNVIIPDTTLLAKGSESGYVEGYGDVPSDILRHFVGTALTEENKVTLRKLYANPSTGALTGMESVARKFPPGLARLIDLRDRRCRTPWCDAPIRHHDHIQPHAQGGETSLDNGAGLCAACNQTKEADGWHSRPRSPRQPGVIHIYDIETPTGHRYSSEAPKVPVARHYVSFLENDLVWDLCAV